MYFLLLFLLYCVDAVVFPFTVSDAFGIKSLRMIQDISMLHC